MLATSAYMLGWEQEYMEVLERAYRAYLDTEEPLAAVRCPVLVRRRGETTAPPRSRCRDASSPPQ